MKFFDVFKNKSDKEIKEPITVTAIKTKPRRYWGYCENDNFYVGCNGATIYIYDKEDNLLAKFKDIPYAYRAKFVPYTNILVAKSTAGYLGVFNLNTLSLIKKIKVSRIDAQDEGFAFTKDGNFLYNIEKPYYSFYTQITIYNTVDFNVAETLFKGERKFCIKTLEFDKDNKCYVLGYFRDNENVYDYGFVGELSAKKIKNIKKLEKDEYDYIESFKHWEDDGFTEKAKEYSHYLLKEKEIITYVSLKDLYKKKYKLL